jgi:hypothetical protein
MATTTNDNIVEDSIPVLRGYGGTYDSTYVTWRWDNIPAIRRVINVGGTTSPGPGSGYGQIFPIKQDR